LCSELLIYLDLLGPGGYLKEFSSGLGPRVRSGTVENTLMEDSPLGSLGEREKQRAWEILEKCFKN